MRAWLASRTVWQVALACAVALHAWYFAALSVEMHRGLGTSAYDFGLYDQGLWLLSRFDAPFVTLMGRNLFGDHTSFVLLALVPLYWLTDNTSTLLVVQALVVALGALPVFVVSRRVLGGEGAALALAGAYLLHPAVGWIVLENYHPDSFLGLTVGVACAGALLGRWRWYFVGVVLTLLVKEDALLVVVPLGAWVAVRRNARIGVVTSVFAAWFTLVAMFGIQRGLLGVPFRNSWRFPFGGPLETLASPVVRPLELLAHLAAEGRPLYLLQVLAPLAFAMLAAPGLAVVAVPVLASNVLSTFWYQHQIQYHYTLVVLPVLVMASATGIARLGARWRRPALAALLVASLAGAWLWSPLPLARPSVRYNSPRSEFVREAMEALERVPGDAVVSAFHPLTAHLARRPRVYSFPVPFERRLYGPDGFATGGELSFAGDVEFVVLPVEMEPETQVVWHRIADRFELAFANSRWMVWQRASD
jgi:uncharacterized membrane protein